MEREEAIIQTAVWAIALGLHNGVPIEATVAQWLVVMRALEIREDEMRKAILALQRENDRRLVELMWTRP